MFLFLGILFSWQLRSFDNFRHGRAYPSCFLVNGFCAYLKLFSLLHSVHATLQLFTRSHWALASSSECIGPVRGEHPIHYPPPTTVPQFSLQNRLKNCYFGISLIMVVSPFGFTSFTHLSIFIITITFGLPIADRAQSKSLYMCYVIYLSPQAHHKDIVAAFRTKLQRWLKLPQITELVSRGPKCSEVRTIFFYHTSSQLCMSPQSKTPHVPNSVQRILTYKWSFHSRSFTGCQEYLQWKPPICAFSQRWLKLRG